MITVALVGPDGAGKTTVGRQLELELPRQVKYLYMGVSADSSNHMLPTTRLLRAIKRACGARPDNRGPRDPAMPRRPQGFLRRMIRAAKSTFSLLNRVSEEWYRQALIWYYQRQQESIVILDRHYFCDYYAYDIADTTSRRSFARRIHGYLLDKVYPKPDLCIYLDAPSEVLLARKGEGTVELLEQRRRDYLQVGQLLDHFEVVDATRPQAEVANDVRARICKFYQSRLDHKQADRKQQQPIIRKSSSRKNNSQTTILVTDAARGSAVTVIRSLGRRGYRVIAADAHRHAAGMHSRYAAESLVYPDPESSPADFVEQVLERCQTGDVNLIIPVTDAAIVALAQSRRRFEGLTKLAIQSDTALSAVLDKSLTFAIAERLNVPMPRTVLVHELEQALDATETMGWPVVLKPVCSRFFKPGQPVQRLAVRYADNQVALVRQARDLLKHCPFLLQEYYAGEGHGVELLMHRGRAVAAFQHRRLREVPVHGGPSALRESVPVDPVLLKHSVSLLGDIQWTGLAMVEFKVGADGPRLMEINGRIWGSLPLAVYAGMDFPARLAELHLNQDFECPTFPDTRYQPDVRAHNLELELNWIISVLRGRRRVPFGTMPPPQDGLRALSELFSLGDRHDILSFTDPLPGLADFARIARRATSRLWSSK